MPDVVITRHLVVAADLERTFDLISAEDVLPRLLKRFLVIPAVTGTAELTGPWTRPGVSRTVLLSDGGSAHEELTAYERPRYFAYRVTEFSPPFGRLAHAGQGRWWLASDSQRTFVRWSYSFHATTRAMVVPLWLVGHLLWSGYMRRALRAAARILSY